MLAHPVGRIGIERRRRLVEQQQFRRIDQRLRQRDARLLPGGELAVWAVEEILQVEIVGELRDAVLQLLDRIEAAEHGEVLPHREPHRHVDIGAFEIHPPQHLGAFRRHRMAQHLDGTGGRQHQPHDHGDRRGLAGAIAAEQAGDAAARDCKRDVVDGAHGLVLLDQTHDGDRGRSCRIRRAGTWPSELASSLHHAGRSFEALLAKRKASARIDRPDALRDQVQPPQYGAEFVIAGQRG